MNKKQGQFEHSGKTFIVESHENNVYLCEIQGEPMYAIVADTLFNGKMIFAVFPKSFKHMSHDYAKNLYYKLVADKAFAQYE